MANGLCYRCTVAAICSVVEDEKREKPAPVTADQGREAIARMRAARSRDFDAAELEKLESGAAWEVVRVATAGAPVPSLAKCTHPEGCTSCSWCGFKAEPKPPPRGAILCRACGAACGDKGQPDAHWTQTDGARCEACWLAMAGRGKPSRFARARAWINARPKAVSAASAALTLAAALFLAL